MLHDIKTAARRAGPNLAGDAIGGAALFVLLISAFCVPAFF